MIHLLAPAALVWLPLAALPVLFHLFLRLRRQTRVFPSLLFFLAADPHLHARRRIREWLVLALRTLVIALTIAALARPQWRGAGGAGEVAVALVLDNSASMAAADAEGRSRLQRAVAAAQAILEDPAVRRAGILLTVDDASVPLPRGLVEDPAVWRATLDAVRPTHTAGRPGRALHRAAVLLSGKPSTLAELHLFTDAQAGEWSGAGDPPGLPSSVRRVVHRIGGPEDEAGSVAIEALERSARLPVADREETLQVLLRNVADQAREAALCLSSGTGDPLRKPVRLEAQARLRVPVTLRPEGGRDWRVRVWLEGDAAAPAAESWLTAEVSTGVPAWLAGGEENCGLLPEALSPGGDAARSGVLALPVEAGRLRDAPAEAPALVALCGAVPLTREDSLALQTYVTQGGTLLLAPGAVDGELVLPDWCSLKGAAVERRPAGIALLPATPEAGLWDDLRSSAGQVALPPLRATRWVRLEGPEARPLLVDSEGGVLAAERPLGEGRIVASGLAWTPAWSDLPQRGAFLAMVQSLVLTGRKPPPILRAGDETQWRALLQAAGAGAAEEMLRLEGLAGTALRIEGAATQLPAPALAGVYRLTRGERQVVFAVGADPSEAARPLPGLSHIPWPARNAAETLRHRHAIETAEAVRRGRQGRSLFAGLAGLALAAALAESRLAQRPAPAARRSAARGTKGGRT